MVRFFANGEGYSKAVPQPHIGQQVTQESWAFFLFLVKTNLFGQIANLLIAAATFLGGGG
jgi:hypothetical protein